MKMRNGFVSNSSSSSFVIKKDHYNHDTYEKMKLTLDIVKDHLRKLLTLHDEFNNKETDFDDIWTFSENPINITIFGGYDNSIPGDIMDWMEGFFNAERTFHG